MSLVDSDHVQPTTKRNNVRYFVKAREDNKQLKPAMTIFERSWSDPNEKMCPNCFRTAFSSETTKCPRCGSKM